MRSKIIACSLLLAACKSAPADEKLELGPFDSGQLKITWFRFELPVSLAVDNPEAINQYLRVKGAVEWESHWRAIFSHSWLRQRGYKAEEYLRHVPNLRTAYSDFGFPDDQVRKMVATFVKGGLLRLADVDPAGLTKEWFDAILKTPPTAESYKGGVVYARILVVESDKARKTILLNAFRNDPAQFEVARKLHGQAAQLMSLYSPEVAGARVEKPEDKPKKPK